ncbi:aldehyde ferredoxin oxidoreductase family protein [Natranaerobius trueperi]|uniref:aldehyde ferredoxin oxidoreductase family protein n=1 Tax=Natranaerobius trueperi TaxID=759412 RepID=UPI001303E6DF|nr:aldehyde ferredoxin oxidoreductase family protein [Natranaerobius trueperi]
MNRRGGAMDKVLYVNLSDKSYWVKEVSKEISELFVGGKGLATWLLYNETKSHDNIDPYGEENPVIFAGGPLTGTDAPAMRGVAVSTSPLTGGYVDSYYGGHLSQEIKYAGFDALVVKGISKEPVVLNIENDNVEFLQADQYWGLDSLEVNKKIKEDQNDSTLKIASIGQAGENLIPYSLVSCEYNRHAGRGGIGAVMGSKKLKAFALKGTNVVKIDDHEKFEEAIDMASKELKESEEIEELTQSGTAPALWFAHSEGLLPVKNYQKGTFNPNGLAHTAQREKIWLRDVGCASCPIRCSKVGVIREGKRKGTISDIVEYETAALMGTNLGLSDIKEVAYLVYLCDSLGMDGMSAGSVIGFAMECFEEGILKPEDYDGIKLTFGSSENVPEVLEMIANRKGKLGKLLAQGTKNAAAELGKEAEDKASHVKGMDIPAWGPRSTPGMGLAYMTADRGACHQRAFPIDYEVGGASFNGKTYERLQVRGKAETVASDQNFIAGLDAFVKCDFGTFGISEESYLALYEAATGENMSSERLYKLGERIWNLSRVFNLKQGLTKKDEKLPKRFYEPLPDGPGKGHKFTKEDEKIMLQEYYYHRGWNEEGEPTDEKLKELNLSEIL